MQNKHKSKNKRGVSSNSSPAKSREKKDFTHRSQPRKVEAIVELPKPQRSSPDGVAYERMISKQPYHELYVRNSDRKITIICAPTNSGKTYQGIQKIKSMLRDGVVDDSVMLFPLRVLALQIQQDALKEALPCSLITGEEQDIDTNATLSSMTVEVFDTEREYGAVFLDEGQLAFLDDRSAGYLRVLCGARCKHLIIACAPSALEQMKWFLGEILKVEFEVEFLERKTPLVALEQPVPLEEVKSGDLIVAFSRTAIHELANKLSSMGLNVGALYGALSPAARRAMLEQYRAHSYDVLVATDAIGMGVSAPACRVLFSELKKFDGKTVRLLNDEEIRQIAGRAGRYGYAAFGEAGVLEGLSSSLVKSVIEKPIEPLLPPQRLYVLPDKLHMAVAERLGFVETLSLWAAAIASSSMYAVSSDIMSEIAQKAFWLDEQISAEKLAFSAALKLLFVTFPMGGNGCKFELYKEWAISAAEGKFVAPPVASDKVSLEQLENMTVEVTLMMQLSRVFPRSFVKEVDLLNIQNRLGEVIAHRLEAAYAGN